MPLGGSKVQQEAFISFQGPSRLISSLGEIWPRLLVCKGRADSSGRPGGGAISPHKNSSTPVPHHLLPAPGLATGRQTFPRTLQIFRRFGCQEGRLVWCEEQVCLDCTGGEPRGWGTEFPRAWNPGSLPPCTLAVNSILCLSTE